MYFKYQSLKWNINIISKWLWFPYVFVVLWLTFFNRESYCIRYELTPFWEYRELFCGNEPFYYLQQIVCNILLFVPLGFMFPTIFKRYRTLKTTFITGLLFSVCIELLQLVTARGLCEFDDVFNNTLGAVIGYGFYHLTNKLLSRRQ